MKRVSRTALLPLLLIVVGGVSRTLPVKTAGADWSPNGNTLVFWTDWDGNFEIYSVETDGSSLRNLSRHPAEDANPVWSPDGRQIAFYSKRAGRGDIFVMNADGSSVRNLTVHPAPDHNPSWSPDGSRIAFQSYRDGHGQIYVMEADGSNQRRVSRNELSDTNPDWSPDGKHILFVSSRDGRRGIFVMDVDGRNRRQLILDTQADLLNPKWSPDGARFVFHSLRSIEDQDYGTIFTAAADGSDVLSITDDNVYHYNPYYSPGGDSISYNVSDPSGISVWIMSSDGSHRRRVTGGSR